MELSSIPGDNDNSAALSYIKTSVEVLEEKFMH